ncbi:MAG TPA: hypothetical protein VIK72_11620 [Clostridiaceae bacterium]
MTNISRILFVVLSIVGAVLLLLGGLVFTAEDLKMVSGLCIGFGSVMLALGIGNLLRSFMVSAMEDEKMKHLKAIEVSDERNTRIREKSGYMVSKIMNYMICGLVLALGFMNVNKTILITVAFLPLVSLVLAIIFSIYYSKRM